MTTRRQPRIAVLLDYLYSDYQRELRKAVADAASQHAVDVFFVLGQELRVPADGAGRQRVVYDLVSSSGFDGVIVVQSSAFVRWGGVDGMRRYCRRFEGLAVCGVSVDLGDPFPSVMVDNIAGMTAAVEHVIRVHGRRRIAYLGGPDSNSEARDRELAYRRTLEAHGIRCDELLLGKGDFTAASGHRQVRTLLHDGVEFDAIVAANDYMALGAITALGEAGLSVPGDVVVAGFDDINIARLATPALTTVRQPVKLFGCRALDVVLDQLRGEPVARENFIAAELVKRQSCGCDSVAGYLSARERTSIRASERKRTPRYGAPDGERRALLQAMRDSVQVPAELLPEWAEHLLGALSDRPDCAERFLDVLEGILAGAERQGVALEEFQRAISLLRDACDSGEPDADRARERLWHDARILITAAAVRAEGWRRLALENAMGDLAAAGAPISMALSLSALRQALATELPRLGVKRAAVSLYSAEEQTTLAPFLLLTGGEVVEVQETAFAAERLAPAAFFDDERPIQALVLGLVFDDEQLGVLVFDTDSNGIVVESLRAQIAASIKTAGLHHKVVEQVAVRERLERERLQEEARIAAQIQTSLSPGMVRIEGLALATTMSPAAQVGGDYHDARATPDGGWLAIGDVTGHGLASGLIMLMLQSMVSVMMDGPFEASPGKVIEKVNSALYSNIRNRLGRDDYASLLILRYERNGRITYAGANETIVVCRARSRRCECIETEGIWVGALPDARGFCADRRFELEHDDVLVLYTDGVTEARDAHREQFGLERLCTTIEANATTTPEQIRDAIMAAVHDWSANLDDDLSLVVCKYSALRKRSTTDAPIRTEPS